MYAIIEDSGTQIRVSQGDIIRIDIRDADEQPTNLEFDKVLMIGGDEPKIGKPYVAGASVKAELVEEDPGKKITIIKFKRRKGYRRKNGHRQRTLKVRVTDING